MLAFHEKPNLLTASRYVASDDYYWNCGIFVWRARAIVDAFAQYAPEIHARLLRMQEAVGKPHWQDVLAAEFPAMPSISIDYAVLEKIEKHVCVRSVPVGRRRGSWQALARLQKSDNGGNLVDGLHCGVDTTGCIIRSDQEHLVTTLGVSDLIIVHTPTATLVADKRDDTAIRKLIAELERLGLERFL